MTGRTSVQEASMTSEDGEHYFEVAVGDRLAMVEPYLHERVSVIVSRIEVGTWRFSEKLKLIITATTTDQEDPPFEVVALLSPVLPGSWPTYLHDFDPVHEGCRRCAALPGEGPCRPPEEEPPMTPDEMKAREAAAKAVVDAVKSTKLSEISGATDDWFGALGLAAIDAYLAALADSGTRVGLVSLASDADGFYPAEARRPADPLPDEQLDEIEKLIDATFSEPWATPMSNAARRLLAEVRRLRAWKAEALAVLAEWEQTWQEAGRPGRLGGSKAVAERIHLAMFPSDPWATTSAVRRLHAEQLAAAGFTGLSSHPDEDSVTAEPDVTWPGDLRTESRARASRELIRDANAVRDLDGTGIVGRLADMLAGWLQVPAGETVTTVEELDALPLGAVLARDSTPTRADVIVGQGDGWGTRFGVLNSTEVIEAMGTLRILFRPTPEGSET